LPNGIDDWGWAVRRAELAPAAIVQPSNVLFLMSDEHTREVLGCYGNQTVQTPNLDRLAASGTRFDNAYTPSPICVSARASLATGRWVHDIGAWSSAEPYTGGQPGWGHELVDNGHRVISIGKLHYRSSEDPNGFDQEYLPLHVINELGWLKGLIRDPLPSYDEGTSELADQVGVGETDYTRYDRKICNAACEWIGHHGTAEEKPWMLFVSFVSPHYPLQAPQAFFDLHTPADVGRPRSQHQQPSHPVLEKMYQFYDYDRHFSDASTLQARLGYYGLCSFVDHLVGRVLDTLADCGLTGSTRVIYTSDHGELLGNHGMWTKMLMYEESAGIPLIISGPGIPSDNAVSTPASLVDCHPTIVESVAGVNVTDDAPRPGHSLLALANGDEPDRTVLSEYHDGGAPTGYFMIRRDEWKYVHYVGAAAQLFNLRDDPFEENDLGHDWGHRGVRSECEAALRALLDPDAVNRQAFADQARRIEALGGREAILRMRDQEFGFTPLSGLLDED
jgi:choline-sulfatase